VSNAIIAAVNVNKCVIDKWFSPTDDAFDCLHNLNIKMSRVFLSFEYVC